MDSYCLGYTHDKCDKCSNQRNWHDLNQLPDALRLSMQKTMIKISDEKCRLTKMSFYLPIYKAKHDKQI
jgi:hypothetical protein